ncbi:MAG: radical SAM protein [Bacteroidales bacterium]|nr:radical SAM protein [Bacteroidales bacterium]
MITDKSIRFSSIDLDSIFVIPMEHGKNIVYMPLCHAAFYINNEGAAAIMRFKQKIPFRQDELVIKEVLDNIYSSYQNKTTSTLQRTPANPLESNSISIILHQKCNLECSYCFAQKDRGNESLTYSSIKQIVDWWIVRKGKKNVTFIGGGEPTLDWDLLYYAIRYIRQCDKNDEVSIKIVTNGTLLNKNKVRILEENKVNLTISFDILPDIQNSQRKYYGGKRTTYSVVDELIRYLNHFKIDFGIRATITENSVIRLSEMVKHVSDNYPHIKKLHLEHITDKCLPARYFKDYTHYFFEARTVGKRLGIDVYNSLTIAQKTTKYFGFCNGDKCFIPQNNGDIVYSFCHRFSGSEKEYGDNIRLSTFLPQGFHLPNKNYKLFPIPEDCNNCFARWHCAGGCAAERIVLSPKLLKAKCEMVKEFCKKLLVEEMEVSIGKVTSTK